MGTSAGGSSSPVVAELAARTARDRFGPFARNLSPNIWAKLFETDQIVWELVEEGGTVMFYTGGRNYDFRAGTWIIFPDQRWLRFLVRGTRPANAIMTAIDQAGNKVARYRIVRKDGRQITSFSSSDSVEIIVHPGRRVTDELALALAISTEWLWNYYQASRGGG
jgi:hypothetical protein